MKTVLVLCALVSIVVAQNLPALAAAYSVDVEANILEEGITRNLREYYDANLKLGRYEINNADSYTTRYVDYGRNLQYVVVNDATCDKLPIPAGDPVNGTQTLADFATFTTKYKDNITYVGTDILIRGIPCDRWTVNFTTSNNDTVHQMTLDFYFTVSTWRFVALNITRKPVRIQLTGAVTRGNTTILNIRHAYDLINYVPKAPLPTIFSLPRVCLTPVANVAEILTQPEGQGLAAGMFFLGFFIGDLVVAVSIWAYCRKKQKQLEKFNRNNMEMTRHDDS